MRIHSMELKVRAMMRLWTRSCPRIHSMELKVYQIPIPLGAILIDQNPFNGIERGRASPRRIWRKRLGRIHSMELKDTYLTYISVRGYKNPFNGIERASPWRRLPTLCKQSWIHSMELKEKSLDMLAAMMKSSESIQWNWKYSFSFHG